MSAVAGGSASEASAASWAAGDECPVCRRPLGATGGEVAVPDCCGHSFCVGCIRAWVSGARSNCPMDRREVSSLRVYDAGGTLLRTEPVQHREQLDLPDLDLLDDGTCPECGWMGMRATVGVCMHCMYHHENPNPVPDCPQCMEDESNPSDDDWTPASVEQLQLINMRRMLRSSNNQHVILEAVPGSSRQWDWPSSAPVDNFIVHDESDEESDLSLPTPLVSSSDSEEETVKADVDFAEPGPSTSRAPAPTRRPAVKKTVRRSTAKRKTKTKKRRKTKKKRVATKTKRKRKVKKRRTTRKTTRKRVSKRPTLPEDSTHRRLARILGVKPPKLSGQMLPRGCKKRPLRPTMSADGATVVHRAVESLDYHHRQDTLHIFGGHELNSFSSDSDSEEIPYAKQKKPVASTSSSVIRRFKNNALLTLRRRPVVVVATPAAPVDLLSSILKDQGQKFEIASGLGKRLDPYKMPSSSVQLKCSPGREDEVDLYADIPQPSGADGGGNNNNNNNGSGDNGEDDDLFRDELGGGGGSSNGGGDDGDGGGHNGGRDDDDDDDDKEHEETEVKEEEDEDELIDEMVIDERVLANDDEEEEEGVVPKEEPSDPLKIETPDLPPPSPSPPPSPPTALEVQPPIFVEVALPEIVARPQRFQYSSTSLQFARHLNVDEEVAPAASPPEAEEEDFPEEPLSEPEDPPAPAEERSPTPPVASPLSQASPSPPPTKEEWIEKPPPSKVEARKRSLVEELFGSDVEEPVAKPEEGEIKERRSSRKKSTEKSPAAPRRQSGERKKKKKRRRRRSSSSGERRRHSRKHSPEERGSRRRRGSRSRVPVRDRLGPRRGRSRDTAPEQKEVFSAGDNILVSVNFSKRRRRIAEIAAKRRPVAVINLAVDDDKSPVVEKGDSPKEVIDLIADGWSSDPEDEPPRKTPKAPKAKETGPKTPPEPQVKFSITARPQLKLKNVLGAHDDDDDETETPPEAATASKPPAETYDPFNPTASPAQENEPPRQAAPVAVPPPPRPLSPPKLLTELPRLERPPPPPVAAPVAAVASAAAAPVGELFPGLPANVANILCSSQLQNVFTTPQLNALAVPLLLSAPCFVNMQNVVAASKASAASKVSATLTASAASKPDGGVVDMELESPYSPAASEGDDLFEPPISAKPAQQQPTKESNKSTPRKELKTTVTTSTGKKDISIKMEKNKLKIVGQLPNATIENQVKEKFLKKLNRQERVVEEVKVALKPHYTKKLINKEDYKDILRRAVPKICHNKSGEINPAKIKGLVNEYVKRIRHQRNKAKKV